MYSDLFLLCSGMLQHFCWLSTCWQHVDYISNWGVNNFHFVIVYLEIWQCWMIFSHYSIAFLLEASFSWFASFKLCFCTFTQAYFQAHSWHRTCRSSQQNPQTTFLGIFYALQFGTNEIEEEEVTLISPNNKFQIEPWGHWAMYVFGVILSDLLRLLQRQLQIMEYFHERILKLQVFIMATSLPSFQVP